MIPDALIPATVTSQISQALVTFLCHLAAHLGGEKIGHKLRLLGTDRIFKEQFDLAFKEALERFKREYIVEDEDLVREILKDPGLFENRQVRDSLLALIKAPTGILEPDRLRVSKPFSMLFPERKNRQRVDRAVNFLLHCVAQQVWHLPSLRPIYSLYFESTTAQAASEQLQIQKQSLYTLQNLQTEIRVGLVELLEVVAQNRDLSQTHNESFPHNLPSPDYTEFVGRDEERERLFKLLQPYPESRHHLCSIEGVGGVGKTSLALAVAYRYIHQYAFLSPRERFQAIIWVSAKERVLTVQGSVPRPNVLRTLQDICMAIAIVLDRSDIKRSGPSERVELVRNALSKERTLLIVDNFETVTDQEVIAFLRELPDPAKAIVTSRCSIDVAYPFRLGGLPLEASKYLALQICEKKFVKLTDDAVKCLHERTGGLPLAIVWAVGQIALGKTLDAVLQRLAQAPGNIAEFCFQDSYSQITNTLAGRILRALALLPGSVPREVISYIFDPSLEGHLLDDALATLERLSLVVRRDDRFMLLPLLGDFLLSTEYPDPRTDYYHLAADAYAIFLNQRIGDERERPALNAYYEQVEHERSVIFFLVDWCTANEQDSRLLQIVIGLGYFFHARGYWEEGVEYWQSASVAAARLGEQSLVLRFRTYVAYMFFFQEKYDKAEQIALELLSSASSIEPSYQIASLKRLLGNLSVAKREYLVAEQYLLESRDIMLSQSHQHGQAQVLNDLAECATRAGQHQRAEDYIARAIKIATSSNIGSDLARAYRQSGDHLLTLGETILSKEAYLRSVAAAEDIGWKDDIALAKAGLALSEDALGNREAAQLIAAEALSIFDSLGQSRRGRAMLQLLVANLPTLQ